MKEQSKLSPEFRERLLKESRNPWRGLRKGAWLALFGSALLGFFIMSTNFLAGKTVLFKDIGIQLGALVLFGSLLWFDRSEKE